MAPRGTLKNKIFAALSYAMLNCKNHFFSDQRVTTSKNVHPLSLGTFFMTETWERYGFYVVQTLLVLYLTFHFHWSDKQAFELVGTFTAMTYISSLVGGWVADQLIGQKRAILIATLILLTSYVLLATLQSSHELQFSLAGIAVGTGLLKPNISSLLGNEYSSNSSQRESGFTIFYIGITTGIILGSTIPNILHQHFGWPLAFLSAGLGMIFAFLIFCYGICKYHIADYHPYAYSHRKTMLTVVVIILLYVSALEIFKYPVIANLAFLSIIFFCAAYLIYATKTAIGQQAKQNTIIGLLCLISTLFWAFYFQMFSSFSLLISRIVEPTLFGITFPAPYYVAVQSFGMILFGLILAKPKYHKNIATQATHIGKKFSTSMFLMTIAYIITSAVLHFDLNKGLLSPLYIISVYLMISLAELMLSPVGLSAITLLASPKKVSTMMGIFFVSIGAGGFLSGKLAAIAALPTTALPIAELQMLYAQAFNKILYLLIAATILCFFVNLLIKHLLKDKE